eukprot:15396497-Alexandrium_andersonii.AAC.1
MPQQATAARLRPSPSVELGASKPNWSQRSQRHDLKLKSSPPGTSFQCAATAHSARRPSAL